VRVFAAVLDGMRTLDQSGKESSGSIREGYRPGWGGGGRNR
jgi:hypothetical protein